MTIKRILRGFLKIALGPFGTIGMIDATKMSEQLKQKLSCEEEKDLNPASQISMKACTISLPESNKNKEYQPLSQTTSILTSPAKDSTDAFKGIGTNPLPDLLNVLFNAYSSEENITFFIPLAQVLGTRNHWTLLIIDVDENGKKTATLIDPKYATPGGRKFATFPPIDRSKYPYEETLEMLEPQGISELTVRFTGKQSFFNRWKCGPTVIKLVRDNLKNRSKKVQEMTVKKEKEYSRTPLKRKKRVI